MTDGRNEGMFNSFIRRNKTVDLHMQQSGKTPFGAPAPLPLDVAGPPETACARDLRFLNAFVLIDSKNEMTVISQKTRKKRTQRRL